MTVNEDTEGGGFGEDSQGNLTVTRLFLVTEVTTIPVTDRVTEAANADGIPAIGDVYPGITPELTMQRKRVSSVDTTTFQVTCEYAVPGGGGGGSSNNNRVDTGGTVEISGSSAEVETNKDRDGGDMTLGSLPWWQSWRVYPSAAQVVDIGDDNRPHVWESRELTTGGVSPRKDKSVWQDLGLEWNYHKKSIQNIIVQKFTPAFKLRVSRRETTNPVLRIRDNTGHINETDVLIGAVNWPAKRLLCESITAVTNDGGTNYSVTYNFIYAPEGWGFNAIYTSEDGLPAYDYVAMNAAIANSGSKTFDVYPESNFGALNLNNTNDT